jgi:thiol-disulfide isomerase/thioredoxin
MFHPEPPHQISGIDRGRLELTNLPAGPLKPAAIAAAAAELTTIHCEAKVFSGAILIAHQGEIAFQSACGEANRDFNVANTALGGDPPVWVGGAPTVVMFWSRYCAPSAQVMPWVAELAARLADDGTRLVAVTRDSPADAETYLQGASLELPTYFDTHGEAARVLNSWGTPQYFVLAGSGRLRFAFGSLSDVQRQMTALSAQEQSATP